MKQNTNGSKRKYVWLLIIILLVIAIIYASRDRQQQNNPAQSDKAVLNSKYEKKSLETIIKHQNDNSDQSEGNESTGQDVIKGDTDKQSNTKLEYGASNLLYKEVLKRAGTEMECERYWILPSSIHECILVPCNIQFQDASMLRQLVIDINKKLIPGDFLSNSIYQFDCHTGCLSKIEESQEVIQWNMCLQ